MTRQPQRPPLLLVLVLGLVLAPFARAAAKDDAGDKPAAAAAAAAAVEGASLPPGAEGAKDRLEKSPRHGEFVDVAVPGAQAPLKAYVVYPERKDKAGVVIVIHEIFGLSDWVRAVADQLAADGFIAVAPDFLSGMGPGGGGTEAFTNGDEVRTKIRELKAEAVVDRLNAARAYGQKLPASNGRTATIGFCWGGAQSFHYATAQPELHAAVVYYGTSPASPEKGTSPQTPSVYANIQAPVLGLYGSDDARVNATIEPAAQQMKQHGKSYTPHIYEGAGHGFLRQQTGENSRDGANLKAAQQAWAETVKFLRENLEGGAKEKPTAEPGEKTGTGA